VTNLPHGGRLLARAIATTFAATLIATSGCGSTCASNCPPFIFNIWAPPGENLDVLAAPLTGPACPAPAVGLCAPDRTTGLSCVYMTIIAAQPGTCRLDLTFRDARPPFSVTAEFGPETHQGCCHGLPVLGPDVVTIPPLHAPPADAGTDAGAGPVDGADTGATDAPTATPDADSPADSNNGAP
jgi:hypothetical protein